MIVMKDIFQGYHKNLHNLQNDLHFLPERMKIKKIEKLVTNLHDQEENVTHKKKKKSKQASSCGLVLKKSTVIKFIQKTSLKSYIHLNKKS